MIRVTVRARALVIAAAAACSVSGLAFAGTISEIPLGSVISPQVIDFESAASGPVSDTASVFTSGSAFLLSVSATGTPGGDIYSSFAPSTRGLFVQGGSQLILATRADNALIDDFAVFTFNLKGPATQFGFEVLDQVNQTMVVNFFSGITNVGSTSFTYPADNVIRYFENTDQFDRVVVSALGGVGYGLDNITVGNLAIVPEPGTMALFGVGLAGLVGVVARRRRAARPVTDRT